jgi:hypothetical protein
VSTLVFDACAHDLRSCKAGGAHSRSVASETLFVLGPRSLQVHQDTKLALNRRMENEHVNRTKKGDNATMRQAGNQTIRATMAIQLRLGSKLHCASINAENHRSTL